MYLMEDYIYNLVLKTLITQQLTDKRKLLNMSKIFQQSVDKRRDTNDQ